MTTSGVTTESLTALDLITAAFGKLNLVIQGQTAPSGMASGALTDLNLMLKTWAVMPRLWLVSEASQALTAAQASYVLAAGIRKVLSARRRTNGIDTPLSELGRQEYYDLPTKSATGMPVNWYQDRQRGAVTVYLWLAPDATTAGNTTLEYTYARQIEVFTALGQTADLPDEWQEAIIYNLAARLIPTYGADPQTAADIRAMASMLLSQLTGQDQEETSIFMQPASPFNR